jgi:hypothetical protein
MERTESQRIIAEIKALKKSNKLASYHRIIEQVESDGGQVSLSTLRRICSEGSEANASSFTHDTILVPVRDALKKLQAKDLPNMPDADVVDALKAVIHVQDEEIANLHDMRDHLEKRIAFLLEQIERKDRRMDEKDEIIRRLMEKVL